MRQVAHAPRRLQRRCGSGSGARLCRSRHRMSRACHCNVSQIWHRPWSRRGFAPGRLRRVPTGRIPWRHADRKRCTPRLRLVAPGTPLREGIDRILQANMGALIVVGDGPDVLNICSGGFLLDAEFTPQRLSELAKMDGAIILASDGTRVARANVHLVPDPDIPTTETGTRHRTAERVARQIAVPVITVSEEMSMVSVHYQGMKQTLEPIPRVLRACRPGAADSRAVQVAARRRDRRALGARSRRPRDGARRRYRAATRGDGAPHRRGDRGVRRRTRPRRSARRAATRRAHGRGRRRPAPRRARTTSSSRSNGCFAQVTTRLADITDDELLDLRVVVGCCTSHRRWISIRRCSRAATGCSARFRDLPEAIAEHVIERFGTLPKVMRAASPTSSRSKVWAKRAPGRSRTACRASRRRRSSTGTRSERRVNPSRSPYTPAFDGCIAGRPHLRRHGRVAHARRRRCRRPDGARPSRRHAAGGLVLHPDIGGLRPLFEDMARRLATHGLAVCAFEPFAALPAVGPGSRSRRRLDGVEGSRRRPAARHPRGRGRPACRRGRRGPRVGARLLHGRPLHVQGRRRSTASTPRSRSTAWCARPTLEADPVTASNRSTVARARWCRRSPFFGTNDPLTPAGRHRRAARRVERSRRLRDRRRRRRRARLRRTTPNATSTVPKRPQAAWDKALAWSA